jgi:hypothetical protein
VLRLDRPVEGIEPVRLAAEGSDKLERSGKLAMAAGWNNTIKQSSRGGAGVN